MDNKVRRYLNVGLDVKIDYTYAYNKTTDVDKSHNFNQPRRKKQAVESKLKDVEHNIPTTDITTPTLNNKPKETIHYHLRVIKVVILQRRSREYYSTII